MGWRAAIAPEPDMRVGNAALSQSGTGRICRRHACRNVRHRHTPGAL